MPEKSNISLSDVKVFLAKKDDAGKMVVEELKAAKNITLEPITDTDAPDWDFSKSAADIYFTADCTMDRRSRRALRKLARKKPLQIQYHQIPLLPRIKLWCAIQWAKLLHKPFAMKAVGSNRIISCMDINEVL